MHIFCDIGMGLTIFPFFSRGGTLLSWWSCTLLSGWNCWISDRLLLSCCIRLKGKYLSFLHSRNQTTQISILSGLWIRSHRFIVGFLKSNLLYDGSFGFWPSFYLTLIFNGCRVLRITVLLQINERGWRINVSAIINIWISYWTIIRIGIVGYLWFLLYSLYRRFGY